MGSNRLHCNASWPNAAHQIEAGLLEDVSSEGPTGVVANRRFVEVLKYKGYAVTYEQVGGSHEQVHWRAALPRH